MPHRRRPGQRGSDRSTRRLLHALLDLYQLLRTPQPIDNLLQAILDMAITCVPGAQRGSLLVLESDRLCYRATVGYELAALRPVSFPAADVYEWFARAPVSQVLGFSEFDNRHLSAEANRILHEHGKITQIRRSMVTMIVLGEQLYGTLVLDNLLSHKPFPAEAETLARLFAEQAGSLLEHALLMERLRQANAQLIEAERLAILGRFIASIAHEINNPLTAVLGYADFLTEQQLDVETLGMLEQLRLGAERVRIIVRNLQLFARQQRSGAGQISLNQLAQQAVTLKSGELALDQIDVELRLDPDLPYTWGDGGQLSQVLLNLLANAQHALRLCPLPRRVVVVSALLAAEDGPVLQLLVSDNGVGMTPEVRARVFEPFFTTRPAGEGSGLGLSICRGIVETHGGTIAVASEPGAGATFTIRLPLRPVPLVDPQSGGSPISVGRPVGLRVLLVDDDPAVVDVVLRSLEGANRVVVARSGDEGLALTATDTYDLVLSDLRMPGAGGLQLYQELQAARPDLASRVLFISGDTSSLATRQNLQATGRPLLAKPFRPEELYAAIAAMLAAK